MLAMSVVLYQFPISHFCEKARWCLDRKGVTYTIENVLPPFHERLTRRLAGNKGTLPLLIDGDTIVADSSSIAEHLDRTLPDVPLIPADPELRARALALEDELDLLAGPPVRTLMYGELARVRGAISEVFLQGYPESVRRWRFVLGPLLEVAFPRVMNLSEEATRRARLDVAAVLDRLDARIGDHPERYLVGDTLTIADITAASLLAAVVGAPGSPYATPTPAPAIDALRAANRDRPISRWIAARYAEDRYPT
jgi:glutathione S-transferase